MAFAALVERHGPMVLRVCRHSADPNDVEDAFQATFLILVKKARSLWVRESLGPWLHRVAHRVATRARFSAARLREHERRTAATRPTLVCERGDWDELLSLLHEEIDRLPERYRVPVVLCDLQGLTHEKAARHLGWPVGTVKSRLARGRELLRGRLSRRGLGLPAGLMICEKGLGGAFRAVELVLPSTLVESTVRAVVPIAAGKALAIGVISSRRRHLDRGGTQDHGPDQIEAGLGGRATDRCRRGCGCARTAGTRVRREPGGRIARPLGWPAQAPAPAYITQSRAMIITRLEEEVAEARARLDRSLRKFRSPDNPAVVRARKTFEELVQRLDRIDRVLVDVVETYPTMFDFSRGPSEYKITSQLGLGAVPQDSEDAAHRLGDESRRRDWHRSRDGSGRLGESEARTARTVASTTCRCDASAAQPTSEN